MPSVYTHRSSGKTTGVTFYHHYDSYKGVRICTAKLTGTKDWLIARNPTHLIQLAVQAGWSKDKIEILEKLKKLDNHPS